VERDTEIRVFVPEEYWLIMGTFQAKQGDFSAKLSQWQGKKPVLKTQADAQAVLDALKGVDFHISKVEPKRREKKAPAPFITSSLQQAASSHLKIAPETTMKLAQSLYENGLITYMRTDSPAVSPEGVQMAHDTIQQLYGADYVGATRYGAKGNAQEAHECIRPTDTQSSPDAVRLLVSDANAVALYDLIYKRFLASQMANAVFDEVHVDVRGGEAVFSTKGSQLVFDGFLRVYHLDEEQETTSDDDEADNKQLPKLTLHEQVKVLQLTPQQRFTKPPSFYSEALLVKALEKDGVGRPSTYAQTVSTLKRRGYVKIEKRKIQATDLGREVHAVLDGKLKGLFEVPFTAQMEATLDEIASGKQDSIAYLKQFWSQVAPLFGEDVIQATIAAKPSKAKRSAKPSRVESRGKCPKCGKSLVERNGKNGAFLGCSGFPKCRHTQNLK
jgi:DNA topoisomerase-1